MRGGRGLLCPLLKSATGLHVTLDRKPVLRPGIHLDEIVSLRKRMIVYRSIYEFGEQFGMILCVCITGLVLFSIIFSNGVGGKLIGLSVASKMSVIKNDGFAWKVFEDFIGDQIVT